MLEKMVIDGTVKNLVQVETSLDSRLDDNMLEKMAVDGTVKNLEQVETSLYGRFDDNMLKMVIGGTVKIWYRSAYYWVVGLTTTCPR